MKKKSKEALLFRFSVLLNAEGRIVIEEDNIDPELFEEAMDDWNPDYPNTAMIVAMIKMLTAAAIELQRDINKTIH
jgi:hypothetical protein|tara:strand:- start:3099 stop:3326 length:228 start_codon:yes stop_codon:yes gene_type:complete